MGTTKPSVIYTTAIKRLQKLKKRYRVIPGGTSAGKTFGILPILIDHAITNKGSEISVVSETVPHLRKGAIKDFLKIMKSTGRYVDSRWNRTLLTYTFFNGSYIEFFSADQEGKVRGPRRNVLYVNECNNITFDTYHQLSIRTSDIIWLDFNPSHKFWVHDELIEDERTEWLTLTYRDNEGLPDSIVEQIDAVRVKAFHNPNLEGDELLAKSNVKNSYWANWYKVYGMGLLGSLEGVVFNNWRQIDTIPKEATLKGYGLDFGYTNDPTAIVAKYEYNGIPIYDELEYRTGLQNSDIIKSLERENIPRTALGYADSAEPKSIDFIARQHYNLMPVKKGPDSINYGIQAIQEYEYFQVTKRSVNLIKELRSYQWAKDREGNTLNTPIDANNHAIDAIRYFEMMQSIHGNRSNQASMKGVSKHKNKRL